MRTGSWLRPYRHMALVLAALLALAMTPKVPDDWNLRCDYVGQR
jgi:hypothetical protein